MLKLNSYLLKSCKAIALLLGFTFVLLTLKPNLSNIVYNYISSQISQTGQDSINTSELTKQFVETGVMSKDTLYRCLSKLISENKIDKPIRKGNYSLTKNEEDGTNI